MGIRRIVGPAVLLAALASSGSAAFAQSVARVAVRDQLTIGVLGMGEMSTKCLVGDDGTCVLTYLGPVKVAGLTPREVIDEVTRLLKAKDIHRNPQVTADLVQVPNLAVTVSGAVRTQGAQMFAGEPTVLDAVLRAGGTQPDAGDEILVVRRADAASASGRDPNEGEPVLRIARAQLEAGDRSVDIRLRDGDLVVVPKAQQVFISGQVRWAGPYTIESGMTLRQVLALAGGVTERGSDRRVEILRKGPDGKELLVKDVTLSTVIKAGDSITVKQRIF